MVAVSLNYFSHFNSILVKCLAWNSQLVIWFFPTRATYSWLRLPSSCSSSTSATMTMTTIFNYMGRWVVLFTYQIVVGRENEQKKNHEDDSRTQDVEQCVIVNVSYSDREVEVQRALNDPKITITLMCSLQWATCVFQSHILHCESIY